MNAEDFIDRGDEYFNAKKYNNALNYYTQAINTLSDATDLDELLQTNDSFLRCFKNRSKCSLELKEYLECIDDADTVLSVYADDKEALYTRSQARKELKQYEKALEDANQLVNLSFNLKEYISDLNNLISKKAKELDSRKIEIKTIIGSKTSLNAKSLNRLIEFFKETEYEDDCKNELISSDGLKVLSGLIKNKPSQDIKLSVMRLFTELCKNSAQRTTTFYNQVQGEFIADLIADSNKETSNEAYEIIKAMIFALTDLENKRKNCKKTQKKSF